MMRKRMLGMMLSAMLAFGAVFTATPVISVQAADDFKVYYLKSDGTLTETTSETEKVCAAFSGTNTNMPTYDSVSVEGNTVVFSGLKTADAVGLNLIGGYSYIFEGKNEVGTIWVTNNDPAESTVTIQMKNATSMLSGGQIAIFANQNVQHKIVIGGDTKLNVANAKVMYVSVENGQPSEKYSQEGESMTLTSGGVISPADYLELAVQAGANTVSFNLNEYSFSSTKNTNATNNSAGGISADTAAIIAAMTNASTSTAASTTTPVAAASATADMSSNSSIDSAKVKTSDNGTAKISSIDSEAESIEIDGTVEVDGVSYKVKTIGKGAFKNCDEVKTVTLPSSVNKIEKGAFKGAKNLKTIRINTKKAITVQKGAFSGVNTKKMTIKVSSKMSDKQYKTLQKTLAKAGYQGKVSRTLK